MFEKLQYDENGLKTVCTTDGKHSDMLMNIYVKKFNAEEEFKIFSSENESAFLILCGQVEISWDGETRTMERENPFVKASYCLHVPKETNVKIKALKNSEILIQQTDNDIIFTPVFYTPDMILYQHFGKDQWDGTGYRIVSTVFDHDNAPYSNMVLGEVFNQPGRWSSYPPHHHPQPEVYYYQFDKPQGFGAAFVGDDVYKSIQGSAVYITDGNDHEQVVAPGYEMCYIWMVRHLDNDPWLKTTRFVSDEHQWLTK